MGLDICPVMPIKLIYMEILKIPDSAPAMPAGTENCKWTLHDPGGSAESIGMC